MYAHLLRLILRGYGEADARGGEPAAVELGVQVGLQPVGPRAGGLGLTILGPLHLLGKAACNTTLQSVIIKIKIKCFPAHDELGTCRTSLVSLLHSVELVKPFVTTFGTNESGFHGYESSV